MIIAYSNGAPIRIRDIGVAVDGPENSQVRGFQNGKPGMLLLIYKQPGANVIDDGARASRQRCRTSWTRCRPRSRSTQVIDRTTTIQASVQRRGAVTAARDRAWW